MDTAFIFPAFISEYFGSETEILRSSSGDFDDFLAKASRITGDDFTPFSIDDPLFTQDELRSQLISYIFSCSCSNMLFSKGIKPDVVAGYSMGLYAALYSAGTITFEEGIRLIKKAFLISKAVLGNTAAVMGSIIGLSQSEIEDIIKRLNLKAEIANTNSTHAHLITGTRQAVEALLEKAQSIGALNISLLNVSTPYHSQLLKETQIEFDAFVRNDIKLTEPACPLVSSINSKMITTANDIKTEITGNLYSRINWMETFTHLTSLGIKRFVECGAGRSLQRIGRFIPGGFTIYPINKYDKIA